LAEEGKQMISERECIQLIQRYAAIPGNEFLIKGIGDDCAVIAKDKEHGLLLTTDTLAQGVHFNLDWHPPRLLGRKSGAVNLSDIAAMGGQPGACLLSVAFPAEVPSWFEDFMAGFAGILQEYDTVLIGGDTVKGRHDIVISVTLLGEAKKKNICYRSGAEPGDTIFVSGPLGNSAAGLALCQKGLYGINDPEGKWLELVKAHLDPEPLVSLGKVLAASGKVSAMMDISDGLATDLAHLCTAGKVGAEVMQDRLPVSATLWQAAAELQVNAAEWIVKGGEDYQLLFTAKSSDEKKLRQLVADRTGREIFAVGNIIVGTGVYLCNQDKREEISYQGYDHFQG
jgi:thiamine-monophosphate kinase